MGKKTASRKISARRAATFLAALGVLVMSSGVALMVAATPANADADPKVVVCKYVSTPGGVLDHIVIVSENSLNNTGYDGSPPSTWTDAQGGGGGSIAIRYANEGEQAHDVNPTECPQDGGEEPLIATASVTFTDPDCDNGNVASFATSGENVTFDSPTASPGSAITVTATADDGAEFDGGGTSATFEHTFPAAEDCSVVVEPPVVSPPAGNPPAANPPTTTTVSTPTVVHAGLAGATTDLRGEQGLALVFGGMVMLVLAGGLRLRGGASRI